MRRLRKEMAVFAVVFCLATILTGCGGNDNGTNGETTAVTENADGTTKSGNGTADTNGNGTMDTNGNGTVDTNANGTVDTNANGTVNDNVDANGNRKSGMEQVGEGIGEVGDGIINGAENVVDDITGNDQTVRETDGTVENR